MPERDMDTNPTPEVTPESDLLNALAGDPSQDEKPEAQADEATDETTTEEVQADQTEDDGEEVEIDGEKLKLPKKVAEAVMRQQDYTRKTQEVAEKRRMVDDRAQYLEARETILNGTFQEAAELQSLQKQLEQFAGLDWNALIAEDPQQAMRLSMARQDLQSKAAEKQRAVQAAVSNAEAARAQHLAKQQELGRAELQRRVGALSEPDRKKTLEQGIALGYTEAEMATIADARIIHALYKAAKWDALQAEKPKAMQKVADAPKAIKSVASVPQRQQQNRAALDRLKSSGRAADLVSFL